MLADQIRYILERGSLESRLLSLQVKVKEGFPSLALPIYASDPYVPSQRDQGYFVIEDYYSQRYIYVCTMEVAQNGSFLSTMKIQHVLDLSKEPEEHFTDQTESVRLRVLHGIVHGLQLIINCSGNIVIHCKNGRTRSPAFLAAYLMIVFGMSQKAAYDYLSSEYSRQRCLAPGSCIDRMDRYIGSLIDLIELVL